MSTDILDELELMRFTRIDPIRENAILKRAKDEIGRLRGEVDSAAAEECQVHREAHMRLDTIVMGAGVFELLHEGGMSDAWENTIAAVTKLAAPAPAMPNGVEGLMPAWIATWMADREILPDDDGDGISEGALVEALNNHERELLNAIPKTPAAVPAGEAVAPDGYMAQWAADQLRSNKYVSCHLYNHKNKVIHGDGKEAVPFYFQPPPAPVQAAPQEGGNPLAEVHEYMNQRVAHDVAAFRRAANPSACELGAVLKEIRAAADSGGANEGQCYNWWRKFEAALQHRGDSRGGEG